ILHLGNQALTRRAMVLRRVFRQQGLAPWAIVKLRLAVLGYELGSARYDTRTRVGYFFHPDGVCAATGLLACILKVEMDIFYRSHRGFTARIAPNGIGLLCPRRSGALWPGVYVSRTSNRVRPIQSSVCGSADCSGIRRSRAQVHRGFLDAGRVELRDVL